MGSISLQRVLLQNYLCKKPPDSVKAVGRNVALKVILVSLLFELFCPFPVTRKYKPVTDTVRSRTWDVAQDTGPVP